MTSKRSKEARTTTIGKDNKSIVKKASHDVMFINLALWKLSQEDGCKFKTNIGYIVSYRPLWVTD